MRPLDHVAPAGAINASARDMGQWLRLLETTPLIPTRACRWDATFRVRSPAGATVHDLHGFFGGLRLRYFGPRALIEDNSARSDPTILLSANLGYELDKTWAIEAQLFNLLNRKDSAIDYFYTSRLPGETAEDVNDIHFHPIEPISFRIGLTAKF